MSSRGSCSSEPCLSCQPCALCSARAMGVYDTRIKQQTNQKRKIRRPGFSWMHLPGFCPWQPCRNFG